MKMSESQENLAKLETQISKRDEIWRTNIEPYVLAFIIGSYITIQAFAAYFYFDSFITLAILFSTGAVMQHLGASQIYFACEETKSSFRRRRILVGIFDYILVILTLASALRLNHYWTLGLACTQSSVMLLYGYSLLKSVKEEIAE